MEGKEKTPIEKAREMVLRLGGVDNALEKVSNLRNEIEKIYDGKENWRSKNHEYLTEIEDELLNIKSEQNEK